MKHISPLSLVFFLAITAVMVACSGSPKPVEETASTDREKEIADSLAKCAAASIEREKNSTGKVSELALLMRQMEEELQQHKASMKSGLYQSIEMRHEGLHTAQSTKANLRNDDYTAYANSYLQTVDELKVAVSDSIPAKHNRLVLKCIECHKSFCTGPIARIKKLKINPDRVSL